MFYIFCFGGESDAEKNNLTGELNFRSFVLMTLTAALAAAVAVVFRCPAQAAGREPFESEGKWGYRDEAGLTVIPPVYASAASFSGGFAEVGLFNGEWALLDESGLEIQRASSPVLGVLSGGLAVFVSNGKLGYSDAGGREVIPAMFAGAGIFSEKLAPARKESWGFINKSGKFVIRPEYEAVRAFSGGLAAFRKNNRWGFIGRNGKQAVKNVFHEVRDFSEGLAAVRLNSSWAFVDSRGQLMLPPDYSDAGSFAGGLAIVSLPVPAAAGDAALAVPEKRWIDREGRVVYSSIGDAGDGLQIIVSSAGSYGFARGRALVIPPRYEAAAGCSAGFCFVRKDGRQVFIDYSGGTALRTDFEYAAPLGCGLYSVSRGRKYGLIGSSGAIVAQAVYDSVAGSGCAPGLSASLDGKSGRLDSRTGEFAPGIPPQAPAPVKPGEKCLGIKSSFAAMAYSGIPAYCSAEELKILLGNSPDCLNCRLALAEIYSSTAAGAGPSDRAAALEALAGAISISSEPAQLHQWRINLMLSAADPEPYTAALLEDYQRLIRLEPYKPEHYRAICRAYSLLNSPPDDIQRSAYYCDLAVKMDTETSYNLFSRANFRRLRGDGSGALEDLRALLKTSPGNREFRLARAKVSEEEGQDFRAVFDYSKILELDKDDYVTLEERALAYIRMGLCAKALPDLESAGKLRPGGVDRHKLAVYRWLCERDIPGTLSLIDELLKPSERCGGSCWRPKDYEVYIGDLYGTVQYAELVSKYQPREPQAGGDEGSAQAVEPGRAAREEASRAAEQPALPPAPTDPGRIAPPGSQAPKIRPEAAAKL